MKPTLQVWAGDDGVNAISPHVAIDLGCILNDPVIMYRLRKWEKLAFLINWLTDSAHTLYWNAVCGLGDLANTVSWPSINIDKNIRGKCSCIEPYYCLGP